MLRRRAAQVVDYQDAELAGRFLDLVERGAAADDAGQGWALTRAAAGSWFKLLTYKDEYEVARLHRKVDYAPWPETSGIEGDHTVQYHLHPPTLRRMGLKRKLPMGKPYQAGFAVLARMKRLRGPGSTRSAWTRSRGRTGAHRGVRSPGAGPHRFDGPRLRHPVALAGSAVAIRGYAEVKDRAVDQWRSEVGRLTAPASTALPRSVIQRLHLATAEGGGRRARAAAMDEGPAVRPVRATLSVTLAGLAPEAPRHEGIVALWFADAAHLARFDGSDAGADVGERLVVDPIVVRGAAWLESTVVRSRSPVQAPRPRPAGRGPVAGGAVAAVARPRRHRPPRR